MLNELQNELHNIEEDILRAHWMNNSYKQKFISLLEKRKEEISIKIERVLNALSD
jgi:hypothetical protein